jgi:hypothetical protein
MVGKKPLTVLVRLQRELLTSLSSGLLGFGDLQVSIKGTDFYTELSLNHCLRMVLSGHCAFTMPVTLYAYNADGLDVGWDAYVRSEC